MAHAGAKVILTSRKVSAGEEVVTKLKSDGVKVFKKKDSLACCNEFPAITLP